MRGKPTSEYLTYINEIVDLYYNHKMSTSDVSRRLDIPPTRVRNLLITFGYKLRTKVEGIDLAKDKLGSGMRGKKRNFTEEHKRNIAESKKINEERVRLKPSGYLEVSSSHHAGKSAHVRVMEEYLGRGMADNEIVHHIDHDKTNNSIDNLALMTKSAHARLHRFEEYLCGFKRNNKNTNLKKGERNEC